MIRGGGERGFSKRESSNDFVTCTGRTVSPAAGTKLTGGSKKAPGISAGRAGSWQHDSFDGVMPPIACPQSVVDELCDGAPCFSWPCGLWW